MQALANDIWQQIVLVKAVITKQKQKEKKEVQLLQITNYFSSKLGSNSGNGIGFLDCSFKGALFMSDFDFINETTSACNV